MKIIHELINLGKGKYGDGYTQITTEELLKIYDDRETSTSSGGTTGSTVTIEGHIILDGNGSIMTQQPNLRFNRMLVSNNNVNNQTIITRPPSVTLSSTAPLSPLEGDEWINNTTWKIYVYYDSYWIEESRVGNGNQIFSPVRNSYASQSLMIADQINQLSNYIYFDGTLYWEYLGTINGDITDYRVFSGGEGSGTVTQVNTGIGLTGGPITTTGTIQLNGQVLSFHNLNTNGLIYRNNSTIGTRTITGSSFITVINGDGLLGNPTISLNTINLNDLGDVVLSTPLNNQVLLYNGSNWVNTTLSGGTVTQINTGIGLTGGPITTTGTISLSGQSLTFHNLSTNGLIYRNNSTIGTRSITGSTFITVTNGDGISGNPTISLNTINLNDLGDIVLSSPLNNQVLLYNGSNWVNSTLSGGTVTQINTGIGLTGGPITTSGTISLSGQSLTFHNLNTNGIIYRDNSTIGTRSISGSTFITVTNGDGISGNPVISLNTINLNDLGDVVLSTPANGQILSYNGTNWINASIPGGGGGTVTQIDTGVGLTGGPITTSGTISLSGQSLTFHNLNTNGIIYRNNSTIGTRSISGSTFITVTNGDGISGNPTISLNTINLNDLGDVVLSTPSNGQALLFNGVNWVNSTISGVTYSLNDLTDVIINSPSNGQVLSYNGTNWINTSIPGGGGGTVTSITAGTGLSASPSNPITTSGTLSVLFGTTSGTVAEGNDSRFHLPVTLGTANGLSLSGQTISLALATTLTAGAISSSDKTKLDGLTNYVHPTQTGIDTSTLSGSSVISRIVVNTLGHTTTVSTRNLTTSDIGAEPSFSKGDLVASTGISFSGTATGRLYGTGSLTITNNDRGSSQNIFKNIGNSSAGIEFSANSNNDTIQFAGSGATSLSFDSVNKRIVISSTDTNTTYTAGTGLTLTGTQFSHTDTSSQASVSNTNGTIIQSITLDTFGHTTGLSSLNGDLRWIRTIDVLSNSSTWTHIVLQSGIDLQSYTTGSSGFPSTLGFAVAFYAPTSDSTSGFGRAFALNRAYNTENYYLGSPNTSGVHNGWRLIYHSGNLTLSTLGGEPSFSKGSLVQGTGITLSGTLTGRLVNSGDITVTLTTATSTTLGGIKLFSGTVQSVVSNAVSSISSRTYGLQVNSSGQGVVNIPWTDTVYTHPTYTAVSQTLSGATVLASFSSDTIGSVTGFTTRTLTATNIGAEPSFSKGSLVQGTGITLSGTLTDRLVNSGNITIAAAVATSTTLGSVELFSDTVQSVVANAVTSTASRTYGIQLNSSGQMVVNVPWTDTNTTNFNIQANGGTQVNISSGEEINFINGDDTTAVVVNQANPTVTFNHNDTSTLSGLYGGNGISSITVDGKGHITAISTNTYLTSIPTLQQVTTAGNTTTNSVIVGGTSNISSLGASFQAVGNIETNGHYYSTVPNIGAGWARGFSTHTTSGTRLGGLFAYTSLGTNQTLNYYALAFGASPWSSGTGLYVHSNGDVTIGTTTKNTSNVYKLETSGRIRSLAENFHFVLHDTNTNTDEWAITTVGDTNFGIYELTNTVNASPTGDARLIIAAGGNVLINTSTDNGAKLRVNGTGYFDSTITSLSTVTASNFITTSDIRLKTNIEKIENALDTLSKFSSYEYLKNGEKEAGFIAQEVEEILPYAVFNNNEGYLTMSDRPILAYIHKAILELKEEIDNIKNKL